MRGIATDLHANAGDAICRSPDGRCELCFEIGWHRFKRFRRIFRAGEDRQNPDPHYARRVTDHLAVDTAYNLRRCVRTAACARALGLDVRDLLPVQPQMVSAGNACLFVAVTGKEQVDRCSVNGVEFNRLKPEGNGHFCLFVFAPTGEGAYSRMFAPEFGIIEDPATGSATGPLAAFMTRNSLLPKPGHGRFVSEQGTKMGRRSLLYFEVSPSDPNAAIPVGGHVTPVAEGTLTL